MATIQAAVFSCLVVGLVHLARVYRRHSKIPGPLVARFTDWWKVYHVWKGDYGLTLRWWHHTYGPLICVGPNTISIGDPKEVPHVYQVNPFLPKGNMYKPVIPWLKGKDISSLVSLRDESEHSRIRRSIGPSFSAHSVFKYESRITECVEEFLGHIEKLQTFDMTQWIAFFSIDNMSNIAFSSNLGCMKHGEDVDGALKLARLALVAWMGCLAMPNVMMRVNALLSYFIGPTNALVHMAVDHVSSRLSKESLSTHGDLMDGFLKTHQQQPETFDRDKVLGMTMTIITGGADPTAFTLEYILYHLLKNPACLQRLQHEIDQAVTEERLSNPPTIKELYALPYLNATIQETLRFSCLLLPSLERVVLEGGMTFCDQHFPAGTVVGCHQQTIHFDPDVYGEDAASFRPERWIEASERKRKTMDQSAMWFGIGKHSCMGRYFAFAVMMKVLAMMVMKFEIFDVDPKARMLPKGNMAARGPIGPYMIRVERRVAVDGM